MTASRWVCELDEGLLFCWRIVEEVVNALLIAAGCSASFPLEFVRQLAQTNGARRAVVDACCLVAKASRPLVLVDDVRISVVDVQVSLQAGGSFP
jgi:hypothetical protein